MKVGGGGAGGGEETETNTRVANRTRAQGPVKSTTATNSGLVTPYAGPPFSPLITRYR